jgi:hypothetical protein
VTTWHLHDYSPLWFDRVEAGWPAVYGGKFVLISDGRVMHLVFAPIQLCRYHGNIVERFARAHGLTGRYGARDAFRFDRPPWVVEGGAKWERDTVRRELHLYGDSGGYGGVSFPVVERGLRRAGLEEDWRVTYRGRE